MLDLVLLDFDGDFEQNDSNDKDDELNKSESVIFLFEPWWYLEATNLRYVKLSINNGALSFNSVTKVVISNFGDGHAEEKDRGGFEEVEEHGYFLA